MTDCDDDYDDYRDDDYGIDDYGDDESPTVTCSQCGREVYEDAAMCPGCGAYITRSTHPFAGRPQWFVIVGVLGIILTMLALVLV